ncbi:MAG: polysaccharide pyruvyl transferase family protein [Clostridiaceae bacterium]|nr:polysaccharide pyruvyl transferase family protein [Clostridiaceae bacterium]
MRLLKEILSNMLDQDKINKIKYYSGIIHINKFKAYKNEKKIFHLLTPVHGNMGDQAIVYATNEFLNDEFKDYKIIEVYKKDIYIYAKAIKKALNESDLIVLIGGGNMGNLWLDEEIDRRFVINEFKNNKIISMPQTISFIDDEEGREELCKTKEVYNKHNNLITIAREKKSYQIMKEQFTNANVILNPDTVLYLHNKNVSLKSNRVRIMTCLRNDKESVLGDSREKLINWLSNNYDNVFNYDTVINKSVTKEERKEELHKMFNEFSTSKLVITDRLHGMVFAAVTKTPCIVTKSLDHKVTGTYEWIKDLNYIKLLDNLEITNVEKAIEELSNLKEVNEINFSNLYFKKLIELIK